MGINVIVLEFFSALIDIYIFYFLNVKISHVKYKKKIYLKSAFLMHDTTMYTYLYMYV